MKFVIVTEGTWGDILPFVAIGKKLKDKGYQVVVCTNELYKDFIVEQGLEFVQTTSQVMFKKILADKRFWQPILGLFLLSKYIGQLFEISYSIIKSQINAGDIVLSHTFTFTAKVASKVKKAHHVNILLSPIQARTRFQFPVVLGHINPNIWPIFFKKYFYEVGDFMLDKLAPSVINKIITQEGLPPAKHFMNYGVSEELCIGLWSDWYSPIYEDQKNFLKLAGFAQDVGISKQEDNELLEWISKGEKPIVATMGSGYFFNTKFVKILTEVSKNLNKRFIVIAQEDEFKNSDMIIFRKHVDLKKVLPLSDIFIYHGGIGSLTQAITNGVPSLVLPMSHDQPDNAYHIEKNRLGLSLSESKLNTKNLTKKIIEISKNIEIQNSVTEAKQKCLHIDGIVEAVNIIEKWRSN